jgi:DNA (cytosine-5)-methyltransferase 1
MRSDGKLVFVDLFAGCGGLSLGLEQAGLHPILFSELNKSAAETYIANRAGMRDLWVPDVYDLNKKEIASKWWPKWHAQGIADGEIDLVCGGPPCQGYSGIGHRRSYKVEKADIPSNHLYLQMIEVIKAVKPKMFLFENVRGITFGRWTDTGKKGEIWSEVQASFKKLSGYYVPDGVQLNSSDYGVPQRRPRVMIVGIRKDLVHIFKKDPLGVAEGLLPSKLEGVVPPNLKDVLGDLMDPLYMERDATVAYPCSAKTATQKYYRQSQSCSCVAKKGDPLTDHEYSQHKPNIRAKFLHMIANEGAIPEEMQTKKFAQRVLPAVWGAQGPSLTVTSMPDDFVHYEQPRIPTVREWARLQTFPDWYQFKGSRTTGGSRRAGIPTEGIWDREVPKYTQIGNAVPVKLAHEIGKHLATILDSESAVQIRKKAPTKQENLTLV